MKNYMHKKMKFDVIRSLSIVKGIDDTNDKIVKSSIGAIFYDTWWSQLTDYSRMVYVEEVACYYDKTKTDQHFAASDVEVKDVIQNGGQLDLVLAGGAQVCDPNDMAMYLPYTNMLKTVNESTSCLFVVPNYQDADVSKIRFVTIGDVVSKVAQKLYDFDGTVAKPNGDMLELTEVIKVINGNDMYTEKVITRIPHDNYSSLKDYLCAAPDHLQAAFDGKKFYRGKRYVRYCLTGKSFLHPYMTTDQIRECFQYVTPALPCLVRPEMKNDYDKAGNPVGYTIRDVLPYVAVTDFVKIQKLLHLYLSGAAKLPFPPSKEFAYVNDVLGKIKEFAATGQVSEYRKYAEQKIAEAIHKEDDIPGFSEVVDMINKPVDDILTAFESKATYPLPSNQVLISIIQLSCYASDNAADQEKKALSILNSLTSVGVPKIVGGVKPQTQSRVFGPFLQMILTQK